MYVTESVGVYRHLLAGDHKYCREDNEDRTAADEQEGAGRTGFGKNGTGPVYDILGDDTGGLVCRTQGMPKLSNAGSSAVSLCSAEITNSISSILL